MLHKYGRALAYAVITMNMFERADPFDVWNYLAFNYCVDLDLNVIRAAQREAMLN